MFNLIQIKRRLLGQNVSGGVPTLSSGELAYNENSNELYYGHTNGTVTIAGSGSYLKLDGNQIVNGDKTFLGLTTLSPTTFSPNSLIDVGGNLLTNVAYPAASADAATRQYVDDLKSYIAANFVDRTNAQTISGIKTFVDDTIFQKTIDVTSTVNASAYNVGGTTVIDNSRNAFFTNIDASGNLTVQGDFTVLGNSSVIETTVTAASAFSVTNTGSGPALTVTQTGEQPVAVFYDDSNVALYVDGKTGTAGYVGIGTDVPNEKLTVVGNISASGTIYGDALEIADNGGISTLLVDGGKVGINTETPNEELTVVGSISATDDLYATNGNFSGLVTVGSLDVGCFSVDASGNVDTCGTLTVGGAGTFASTVSAQGALTVDGTTTLNNDLTVVDKIQVQSSDFILDRRGTHIELAGSTIRVTDDVQTADTYYGLNGIHGNLLGSTYEIHSTSTNVKLNSRNGTATMELGTGVGSEATFNVTAVNGTGTTLLVDFIIDGGVF